jgi:hypothetical protein
MRVAGVYYEVNWRRFKRGASLFFPCLDPKVAVREIKAEVRGLGFKIAHKTVIDDKIRGVRIWRL